MGFYLGIVLQLFGFFLVGLCLFSGISEGDYGKLELVQFLGGSAIFYFGVLIKKRAHT
jgi:hypothetical protein